MFGGAPYVGVGAYRSDPGHNGLGKGILGSRRDPGYNGLGKGILGSCHIGGPGISLPGLLPD